jgi:hypothetical protein
MPVGEAENYLTECEALVASRNWDALQLECAVIEEIADELNQCERDRLTALLNGGKHAARKLKRAQILLAADAGASNEDIARDVGVGGSTVYRTQPIIDQ